MNPLHDNLVNFLRETKTRNQTDEQRANDIEILLYDAALMELERMTKDTSVKWPVTLIDRQAFVKRFMTGLFPARKAEAVKQAVGSNER